MADYYKNRSHLLVQPMIGAFDITPNDTIDLVQPTRRIKATGAGNISVNWVDGSTTVEAVTAGTFYDWRIARVKATGTTATGIRGYY